MEDKYTFFTGQPIFSQLLSHIPKNLIRKLVKQYQTDRYYKKFKTYQHLVTMLYCCFNNCKSLREVTTGMQVCFTKLNHLGMQYFPRRSTLSDANRSRDENFFSALYHGLYNHYYNSLPDSRPVKGINKRLFIIDSTTIKLFSDVMKGMGQHPVNGKRKGGAKAHMMIKADEDVPRFVCITHGTKNDKVILNHISFKPYSIVVFDKAYNNYRKLQQWNEQKVTWVSRISQSASYVVRKERIVDKVQGQRGVKADKLIKMGRPSNKKTTKLNARMITYYDPLTDRTFNFITNNKRMKASHIADIYKRRWQIELLFKRLKQAYPLKYFLGDSENAIKIQIWCSLITDLVVKIVKDRVKRKWSYANIASMIRLHLMSYVDLNRFLNNPDKVFINYQQANDKYQLNIFNNHGG